MQTCRYSALMLEIQYQAGTRLTVTQRVRDQRTGDAIASFGVVASADLDSYNGYNAAPTYYWDSATG